MLILHAPMMVCKLLSKCQLRCKVMRVCTQSPWLPDSGCSGHNLEDRRLCPAQRPELPWTQSSTNSHTPQRGRTASQQLCHNQALSVAVGEPGPPGADRTELALSRVTVNIHLRAPTTTRDPAGSWETHAGSPPALTAGGAAGNSPSLPVPSPPSPVTSASIITTYSECTTCGHWAIPGIVISKKFIWKSKSKCKRTSLCVDQHERHRT